MSNMKYARIPHVSKPVSRILYGTASDSFLAGEDENAALDAMLSLGVNAIDTARQYGRSENSIGRWLSSRGCRDQVVLLSKCGHHSEDGTRRVNPKEMQKDLAESLSSLCTDYIDIYILHRDDPDVPVDAIVETFNDMHAAGKIGAFGGSNWSAGRIEAANEYAYSHNLIPFEVSSPNFGLAEPICDMWGGGSLSIAGKSNEAERKWHQKTRIATVAHSSLGRGMFSGKLKSSEYDTASRILDSFAMKGYHTPENFERLRRCEILAEAKHASVPQIAMSWIFHQDLNLFAVVSTSKASRMQENIDAMNLSLTEQESRYLDLKTDTPE